MNNTKQWGVMIGAFILALAIGYGLTSRIQSSDPKPEFHQRHTEVSQQWTCSMHPQVRKEKEGKCPICAMDLIPVENDMEFSKSEKKAERKIK